ncbi:MAG: hypothetical protein CM15mV93_050 [Caudoviricetes sp.]|nr:MAG: hypothetical protein CM15mV93_050 [Caudoviricetes sp.]
MIKKKYHKELDKNKKKPEIIKKGTFGRWLVFFPWEMLKMEIPKYLYQKKK